jgi:hypothetical protein
MLKFDRKSNTAVARFGSSDPIWVYHISSSEFNTLNHDITLICAKPFGDDGRSKRHFIPERRKERYVLKVLTSSPSRPSERSAMKMKTLKFCEGVTGSKLSP